MVKKLLGAMYESKVPYSADNMSCIVLLPRLLQIAKGEGQQHESVSIDVPCQLWLNNLQFKVSPNNLE